MRFPNSWSAVRIEFARYLIAALRLHGVLPTVAHGRDCSVCLGTYRPDMPGTTVWRMAVPCGHWCCGPCALMLGKGGEQIPRCPECAAVIRMHASREWPGQCDQLILQPDQDALGRGTKDHAQ